MPGNSSRRISDVDAFLEQYENTPSQQSMRGDVRRPRNPSNDQIRVRRRQQRTAEERHMPQNGHSPENVRAQLLAQAARADTLTETARLVGEAEQITTEAVMAHQAGAAVDLAATEVSDTLTPARVHEHHTAATDWIADEPSAGADNARQTMIASAQAWYHELHPSVKADADEFRIQAEGKATYESGVFGPDAETGNQAFLTMAATMRARDIQGGHVVEAAAVGDSSYQGQGAADVLGQNPPTGGGYEGLPGSETDSNRAPAFQDMSAPTTGPSSEQVDQANGDAGTGFAGEERTPSPDPYHAASRRQAHRTAGGGEMPEFLKEKINDESDGDPDAPDPEKDKKEGSVRRQALQGHVATCPTCVGWGRLQHRASKAMATCPPCGGFGGVATTDHGRRIIATLRAQGYSGLHQIDEIADPKDDPSETAYPADVAFPMEQGGWANGPGQIQQEIAQNEQQLAEREQRKGASRAQQIERQAREAARMAYHGVYAAYRPKTVWDMFTTGAAADTPPAAVGAYQDESGWLGDMGQQPPGPGQQDGLPPGSGNNLDWVDPVYGQGGDQPEGPRKPFGADEANDRTNVPDAWAPGQPSQMDQAARGEQLPPTNSPPFPDDGAGSYGDNSGGNQFQKGSSRQHAFDSDQQVQAARQFLAQPGNEARHVSQARQFLGKKAKEYGVRL